jgi:hypothetical protein
LHVLAAGSLREVIGEIGRRYPAVARAARWSQHSRCVRRAT